MTAEADTPPPAIAADAAPAAPIAVPMPAAVGEAVRQAVPNEPASGGPGQTPARRRTLAYVALAVLLVGGGLYFAKAKHGAPAVADAPSAVAGAGKANGNVPVLTVALATAQPVTWPDAVTANGAIAAWQEAVVSAEVSGLRLSQVGVDVGDQVRRGQVLARFDDAAMAAAVAQQVAAVAEAQAHLAEAATNASRAAKLRSSGAISEQDLIQFVTRAQAARAQLDSAEARLQATRLNLQYTRVVAPDDGVISARNAMLGAVAGPGMELFRLVRQNRLEWRAELTAAQLAQVREGQRAELKLPDGTTAVGFVRQLAPVLDDRTRTALAYVELDRSKPSHARAGMYASGTLLLDDRPGQAVPATCIVLRDGHEYVFVVDGSNRAAQVKVTTGRRRGNLVEIVDGLKPGARIVETGGAFLNNGDLVRVTDARPDPVAPQASNVSAQPSPVAPQASDVSAQTRPVAPQANRQPATRQSGASA